MIDWHRLFGITLIDFFAGTPFVVELEKDLSIKQQLLDVVIVRKQPGTLARPLPDGLDNLADHNLLTYKSIHEPLDDWTLDELVGYYVNYRKQTSPSLKQLLPTEQFRLYGVTTRFPQNLSDAVPMTPLQQGIYEVVWGHHRIRVVVLSEIPSGEHNTIWNLFSAVQEKVVTAANQYRVVAGQMSSIINNLFENYQLEGLVMPYTMEDYQLDVFRRCLASIPREQLMQELPIDELLRLVSTDERLKGISTNELLGKLSLEEIKAYIEKQEQSKTS